MATLSYPTETRIDGPLLIEAGHLIALDDVLDQYTVRLRQERERRLLSRAEREVREHSSLNETELHKLVEGRVSRADRTETRAVALYLPGGRTLTSDRFEEAINQPHVKEEMPLGFRCDMEIGAVKSSVTLQSRWSIALEITVRPSHSAAAQELYGALENWASEIRPPLWQQLWLKFSDLTGYFLFMWIFLGVFFLFVPLFVAIEPDAKDAYKQEARQILNHGVDQSNQQKAIELTLAIVSDNSPQGTSWRPGLRFWGYYVAGLIVLGSLSRCPKFVVGIWKGKQRLKLWRLWITTVWVTVPTLVATTVVWPRILSFFGIH
jgi:hypothetical protein